MHLYLYLHLQTPTCTWLTWPPGFPAYLANLGQGPAMAAAYGYGGVGGHQLEDLAALQRSTLAASLPQLVGSQPAAPAANPPTGGKAVREGSF